MKIFPSQGKFMIACWLFLMFIPLPTERDSVSVNVTCGIPLEVVAARYVFPEFQGEKSFGNGGFQVHGWIKAYPGNALINGVLSVLLFGIIQYLLRYFRSNVSDARLFVVICCAFYLMIALLNSASFGILMASCFSSVPDQDIRIKVFGICFLGVLPILLLMVTLWGVFTLRHTLEFTEVIIALIISQTLLFRSQFYLSISYWTVIKALI